MFRHWVLQDAHARLVIGVPEQGAPRLLLWERAKKSDALPPWPEDAVLPASPDRPQPPSLFPQTGMGFSGSPALEGYFESHAQFVWFDRFVGEKHDDALIVRAEDTIAALSLTLIWRLDHGVLKAQSRLHNLNHARFSLSHLAALALPLEPQWTTLTQFHGSWSNEGHEDRRQIGPGKTERVVRLGRPGFDGGPNLVLSRIEPSQTDIDATATAQNTALGAHLANSGNHRLFVERAENGATQLQLAEYLAPGEIVLASGQSYESPLALVAISDLGREGIRQRFQALGRASAPKRQSAPKVQINSWEACYFDISPQRILALARAAAALGVERLILDDGWFLGRRDDRTSLGDWIADPALYPEGLAQLASDIRAMGSATPMGFGLWVEPEMVSPQSLLARDHPHWILHQPGRDQPTGRHQWVLNLGRRDVRDYLFWRLDHLLQTLPIEALKWDCNRTLYPAFDAHGPVAHRQIEGVYELMRRIKARHPHVEIESCSSGGARMDFGVLQYVSRFWPSDMTDAHERVRIQNAAGQFFPPEMLGAHVGPSPNHVTGRVLSMPFRALVAMFGHFGLELDPSLLDAHDQAVLARAIGIYKHCRDDLMQGDLARIASADPNLDISMLTSPDHARHWLRVLRLAMHPHSGLPNIPITGLKAAQTYTIYELDLTTQGANDLAPPHIGGEPAALSLPADWLRSSRRLTGRELATSGIAGDPGRPDQGRLFLIEPC